MSIKRLVHFIPSLIWMAYIYFLSSQQTTGIKGDPDFHALSIFWQRFFILKSFHLIEYAILLILIYFALKNWRKSYLLGYLYALSDEFHQRYTPGRTSRFSDTLIDLLGMTLGLLAFLFLEKLFPAVIAKIFKSPSPLKKSQ